MVHVNLKGCGMIAAVAWVKMLSLYCLERSRKKLTNLPRYPIKNQLRIPCQEFELLACGDDKLPCHGKFWHFTVYKRKITSETYSFSLV